jgi:tRNA (guanine37-N1)-methyltransferase
MVAVARGNCRANDEEIPMRVDVLTLFPGMLRGPLDESILKRAQAAGLLTTHIHDIRDYATVRHRTCDDTPFGGGAGMVMKIAPLAAAIEHVDRESEPAHVVFLTPDGATLNQSIAHELASLPRLMLICGHYEGIDERVRQYYVHRELSIGDYVLTGGELAALVVIDAVARLLDGVISAESLAEESHSDSLLEYPHYTRPAEWNGHEVPAVLRSGNHAAIAQWRRRQRLARTYQRRPELLAAAQLDRADREFLTGMGWIDPAPLPSRRHTQRRQRPTPAPIEPTDSAV